MTYVYCAAFMRDKVRPFQYLLCCCISFGIFCENAGAPGFFGCQLSHPTFITGPRALHRQVVSFKLVNQDVSVSRPWICSKYRGDVSQCCRVQ